MRAIGGSDRGSDVSLHLCSAHRAWSARALLLLQRGRCPIPSAVPQTDHLRSSLDCVATSERGKATGSVMWRVLKEDVMLGVGSEVWHGCDVQEADARQV